MNVPSLVAVALLFALIAGCAEQQPSVKAGPPPLALSFRKSQIPAQGMVAGIQNESNAETLTNVVVRVSGPDEKNARSHKLNTQIEPHDTITIGWIELDGWKLKPADKISIRCEQYTGEVMAVVPEP